MEEVKPIGIDAGGTEPLKYAVMSLVNQFPGLNGRVISYQGLTEDGGISVEPESGTLVYAETTDILGTTRQACQFPFVVVYRSGGSSEYQKMGVTQFLDNLGAWLCREPVNAGGEEYPIAEYPEVSGNRKITGIVRFNTFATEKNENQTQDWVLPVIVNYTHEFQKW